MFALASNRVGGDRQHSTRYFLANTSHTSRPIELLLWLASGERLCGGRRGVIECDIKLIGIDRDLCAWYNECVAEGAVFSSDHKIRDSARDSGLLEVYQRVGDKCSPPSG